MARKFFFVCAGMLMLALSFHFGYTTATAQAPANPIVAVGNGHVYTANGDDYIEQGPGNYQYLGNVFSGAPTTTQRATWGQVKARYAPTPGTSQPQTNDR